LIELWAPGSAPKAADRTDEPAAERAAEPAPDVRAEPAEPAEPAPFADEPALTPKP